MQIIHTIAELRAETALRARRTRFRAHHGQPARRPPGPDAPGQKTGRDSGSPVVASIFVNRLQFAPNEDFDTYPRTLERDAKLLAEAGCDILFAPSEAELYPQPQGYKVVPPTELVRHPRRRFPAGLLHRRVHGGAQAVQHRAAAHAVFGKKDYQQLMVLRNMVSRWPADRHSRRRDLACADDGLALSSRNGYLNEAERAEAVQLIAMLRTVKAQVAAAQFQDSSSIRRALSALKPRQQRPLNERGWQTDYVAWCAVSVT
jgi:pantoate--beta-alanine ligase